MDLAVSVWKYFKKSFNVAHKQVGNWLEESMIYYPDFVFAEIVE